MTNGSRKGGQFERDFCREMSLWWSEGEFDDVFWRSAGSGARATVRNRKTGDSQKEAGDIRASRDSGSSLLSLICFELKRGYNSAGIVDLILKPHKKSGITALIKNTIQGWKTSDSETWALVLKQDRVPAVILFPETLPNTVLLPRASLLYIAGDEVVGSMRTNSAQFGTLHIMPVNLFFTTFPRKDWKL